MKKIFFDYSTKLDSGLFCLLSKKNFRTHNLSLGKQREVFINHLGAEMDKIAFPVQTHSSNVLYIEKGGEYDNVDGLITRKKNIVLSIQVADCVPVFIYDIKNQVKGLIHSGWRGTADKIISNAIKLFLKIGSTPQDIKVVIGPSIRKCCYEVGTELVELFDNTCIELLESKLKLDISSQIKLDLKKFKIPEINIFDSNICTYCNLECHSYRRERTGARMIALLGNIYD